MFCELDTPHHLIQIYRIHNLHAIFAKFLDICKQKAGGWVNEQGNVLVRALCPGSPT